MNEMENFEHVLNSLQQVETPADLFGRIQNRLDTHSNSTVSTSWIIATSIAIVLVIGISGIAMHDFSKKNAQEQFGAEFAPKNQLYP
jgi:hypothetical protein